MPGNDAIRRRKLHEEVLERLLEMINSGECPIGSNLPSERDLMERFRVGRPAVREAIYRLERMGMVEIAQGSRTRITSPSPHHLMAQVSETARQMLRMSEDGPRHLAEARVALETAIVEAAIHRASEDDIWRIEAALAANKDAIAERPRFLRTDIEFHVAVAEATHNPIYAAVTRGIMEWWMDNQAALVRGRRSSIIAYREQERFFEMIRRRDEAGARQAMADHLQRVIGDYLPGQKPSGQRRKTSLSGRK